jgi:hypothetical protein
LSKSKNKLDQLYKYTIDFSKRDEEEELLKRMKQRVKKKIMAKNHSKLKSDKLEFPNINHSVQARRFGKPVNLRYANNFTSPDSKKC